MCSTYMYIVHIHITENAAPGNSIFTFSFIFVSFCSYFSFISRIDLPQLLSAPGICVYLFQSFIGMDWFMSAKLCALKKPDQVIAPHFWRVFSYKHFVWASSCSLHTNTFYIISAWSRTIMCIAHVRTLLPCITLTHMKKESDLIAIAWSI